MDLRWSLKELYTSLDSPEYEKDITILDKMLLDINKWCSENLSSHDNAANKLETYLKKQTQFNTLFGKLSSFPHLILSTEVKNAEAAKYMGLLDDKATKIMEK